MLDKKAVIVTGADSGIGLETAKILARAGARVLTTGRSEETASKVAKDICDEGGIAVGMVVDVTQEADIMAMVDRAVAEFGRLDGASNNAGAEMHNNSTADLTLAEWNATIAVNLTGLFLCMKYEMSAMQKTGGGAIVNNSSNVGLVGMPFATEYSASKHGVIGATRSASCEAAKTGVRVNAVCPGMVMTPMIEGLRSDPNFKSFFETALGRHSIGRFGKPEEIGHAVKWLLSDEASFVNGAALAVDGGYTAL